jgi:hypothetical protein
MDANTLKWLRDTFGEELPIYKEGVKWEDMQALLNNRPDAGEIEWLLWNTYHGGAWVLFPTAVMEQAFAEMEQQGVVYKPGPDDGKRLDFPKRHKPRLKRP